MIARYAASCRAPAPALLRLLGGPVFLELRVHRAWAEQLQRDAADGQHLVGSSLGAGTTGVPGAGAAIDEGAGAAVVATAADESTGAAAFLAESDETLSAD